MNVLLLTKDDEWSLRARQIVIETIGSVQWVRVAGPRDDVLDDVMHVECDALISFLCPRVLPQRALDRFDLALNFHPASHDYPGIGCYNFALYDGAEEYGAVCHHMRLPVDSGPIVMERRFCVSPRETVLSLKNKTMGVMLGMLVEVAGLLVARKPLPEPGIAWSRKAYTRANLERLYVLFADMEPEEIKRRIRATTFPGYPGAHVTVGGVKFVPATA